MTSTIDVLGLCDLGTGSGKCYPDSVQGVNLGLASVSGLISFLAFYQLIRIHSRNSYLGWTRQKVFHLLIGSSNLGYFLYFVLTIIAPCKGWICLSYSCGFIAMTFPKIPFLAAFLLLLSFWVDLCQQSNDNVDDDYDDECSSQEALLEKIEFGNVNTYSYRIRCNFSLIHIGFRQKIVIMVTLLVFAITLAFAMLIWISRGKSTLNSKIVAQVYVILFAVVILFLGGALAYYGLMLVLKMRKVRSEKASSETWKVAGLAIVCVISFSSSSLVVIATNIPLFYNGKEGKLDGIYTWFLLVFYYVIGSSLPSALILLVMKELPPFHVVKRVQESTSVAFINEDSSVSLHHPNCYWTAAASIENHQFTRASPI